LFGCHFFPKLAALRKKFPWRPESILTGKPALCAARFVETNFLARLLSRVASQFRRETGGSGAILNAEFWINPLEMFSDSRRRNSEDYTDLDV
jgi:hypothetical protein